MLDQVESKPLLDVRSLEVRIDSRRGAGEAVSGASFSLYPGQTLGVVGESGSGKSMTALSICRLLPRGGKVTGGQVLYKGEDLLAKPDRAMRRIRGKEIALILQDPMTALDPLFTIGHQVEEGLKEHMSLRRRERGQRVVELLRAMQVNAPEQRVRNYPHEVSGGMRQRIVGAIGISCDPSIIIADEPTTSLDVTTEAAYLSLLRRMQRERGLAILFITHDFGIVARMCDSVAVMYAGRIVETAPTKRLFAAPAHPYTKALLAAVPDLDDKPRRLASIAGSPPSIFNRPKGCAFADRCPQVMDVCRREQPPEVAVGPQQTARCWAVAS